jgi:hypothetical protein
MIRKLLLPAALVGLPGGCVTADYSYRDGYYYGRPSVEYRYHDYGYPYGYGYYPHGGRYYGYYGYPYYGRYCYPPHYYYRVPQRPPVTGTPDHDDNDRRRPPWRDLDRSRTRPTTGGVPLREPTVRTTPTPRPQTQARTGDGSRVGQALRRASETRRRSGDSQEP